MSTPPAYAYAARRPLALLVLFAAIAGGLTIALWLLPLGLLAYAAIVYVGARSPLAQSVAQRPARPKITSATFRAQIAAIERTRTQIGKSAAQAGGPLARLLGPIDAQARDLVDDAYRLCEKGQIIKAYLAGIDLRAIQADVAALDAQLAATQDPYTRDQLLQTRQAREEKLANARDLSIYIDRINSQLRNISATLDNVLAETVRLRTADAVSADAATNQVAIRLSDLKADMDAFQRVLDTALPQSPSP
jgi:hypothetical protein